MVPVVAGLLHREGRLLVCQRDANGTYPFKWEFPGGKVEAGENDRDALRRELREELGIEIEKTVLVYRHQHRYPEGLSVSLHFYRVDGFTGTIENRVFRQIAWKRPAELGQLDFLEGDHPIVQKLSVDGDALLAGQIEISN